MQAPHWRTGSAGGECGWLADVVCLTNVMRALGGAQAVQVVSAGALAGLLLLWCVGGAQAVPVVSFVLRA